ncbi:hypothetical protein SJAV_15870 [Sulfurisphaera javensis]|uniref:Uncharacterized protein n=1 Tax=Sulfurisphaera javensis TaxID=2049879 RepID=A0AAT9GS58_9CREN
MRVKINPLINIIGTEELIILPITRKEDFLLALNFYEDTLGGRLARFILVLDKYREINYEETIIKGDKGVVEAEGVEEDFKKLSNLIKIEKYLRSNRLPLFINIEILKDADVNERGVRGFINYISKYGKIDIERIKDKIELIIE